MVKYDKETDCLMVSVSLRKTKERRMIMIPTIAAFGCLGIGIGCLLYVFNELRKKKKVTLTHLHFMIAGFGFVLLAIILYWVSAGRN